MDKILKELTETLTEWQRRGVWGEVWIEVKAGQPTLIKKTVQQKLSNYQLGGFPHEREKR